MLLTSSAFPEEQYGSDSRHDYHQAQQHDPGNHGRVSVNSA
jgi:hypothetical protein